jgi:ribonuclease HI
MRNTNHDVERMASIFCDGACPGNGTKHAYGGWAWAYWPGPITGEPATYGAGKLVGDATNQRAELTALLKALQWAAAQGITVDIYSDSQYAINCTTVWGPGWKRKGWKRSSGEPLLNLDLIKQLVDLWKPCWPLHHVRGHQKGSSPEAYGNNWVDRAAVAAAQGQEITPNVLVLEIPISPIEHVFHTSVKPTYAPTDIRNWFS